MTEDTKTPESFMQRIEDAATSALHSVEAAGSAALHEAEKILHIGTASDGAAPSESKLQKAEALAKTIEQKAETLAAPVVAEAEKIGGEVVGKVETLLDPAPVTAAMIAPAVTALPETHAATMAVETKVYTDGSSATGTAPLPDLSPAQQDAAVAATAANITMVANTIVDTAPQPIAVASAVPVVVLTGKTLDDSLTPDTIDATLATMSMAEVEDMWTRMLQERGAIGPTNPRFQPLMDMLNLHIVPTYQAMQKLQFEYAKTNGIPLAAVPQAIFDPIGAAQAVAAALLAPKPAVIVAPTLAFKPIDPSKVPSPHTLEQAQALPEVGSSVRAAIVGDTDNPNIIIAFKDVDHRTMRVVTTDGIAASKQEVIG